MPGRPTGSRPPGRTPVAGRPPQRGSRGHHRPRAARHLRGRAVQLGAADRHPVRSASPGLLRVNQRKRRLTLSGGCPASPSASAPRTVLHRPYGFATAREANGGLRIPGLRARGEPAVQERGDAARCRGRRRAPAGNRGTALRLPPRRRAPGHAPYRSAVGAHLPVRRARRSLPRAAPAPWAVPQAAWRSRRALNSRTADSSPYGSSRCWRSSRYSAPRLERTVSSSSTARRPV